MAERILYRGHIGVVICDGEHDIIRFIDRDHVLHIIERNDVEMVLNDDICLYRVLPDKETVTSFYYDQATEDAKCAMVRILS